MQNTPDTKVFIPDNNKVIPYMVNTFILHWFHFGVYEPSYANRNNFHKLFELFHCLDGSATIWLNEEPIMVGKGDWLLIKTGVRHRIQTSDKPYSFTAVHFDIDDPELRKVLYAVPSPKVSEAEAAQCQLPYLIHEIEKMIQACLSQRGTKLKTNLNLIFPTSVEKLFIYSNILNMVYQFISLQPAERPSNETVEISPQDIEMANRIAFVLEDSVFDVVSIANVARKVGFSRSQCTKVFTEVYQVSPRQYASMLKLNKAKELLIQSDLTVKIFLSSWAFLQSIILVGSFAVGPEYRLKTSVRVDQTNKNRRSKINQTKDVI